MKKLVFVTVLIVFTTVIFGTPIGREVAIPKSNSWEQLQLTLNNFGNKIRSVFDNADVIENVVKNYWQNAVEKYRNHTTNAETIGNELDSPNNTVTFKILTGSVTDRKINEFTDDLTVLIKSAGEELPKILDYVKPSAGDVTASSMYNTLSDILIGFKNYVGEGEEHHKKKKKKKKKKKINKNDEIHT